MFNFLKNKKSSKAIAKDRLKFVLIHDRANCDSDILAMMQKDILEVIRKYMDFNDQEIDLKIDTSVEDEDNTPVTALYANIPIHNLHKPR